MTFSPHPFTYFQPYAGKASNLNSPQWTVERTELLKKLWLDGYSATDCAERLGGVTRNAVIGKVHRLGLSGRGQPTKTRPGRPAKRGTAHTRHYYKPPKKAPAERVVPVSEPVSKRLTLQQLTKHTCKWIEGYGEATTYCGHYAQDSYCSWHHKIVYRPGTLRDFDRIANRCLPGRPDFSRTVVST